MIRVNLLPVSRRISPCSFSRIFTVIGIVTFFLCTMWYGYDSYRLWGLKQEAFQTMNRYELLKPTQNKMQAANALQQRIDQKDKLLLSLTAQRQSQYAVLAHLAEIMPPQVWLCEIVVDEQKHFYIKGQADTYSDLARFLDKIERDPLFGNPVLLKTERDEVLSTMKFEITVAGKGM